MTCVLRIFMVQWKLPTRICTKRESSMRQLYLETKRLFCGSANPRLPFTYSTCGIFFAWFVSQNCLMAQKRRTLSTSQHCLKLLRIPRNSIPQYRLDGTSLIEWWRTCLPTLISVEKTITAFVQLEPLNCITMEVQRRPLRSKLVTRASMVLEHMSDLA